MFILIGCQHSGGGRRRPIAGKLGVVGHGPVLVLALQEEEADLVGEGLDVGEQLAHTARLPHLPRTVELHN